MIPLYVLLYFLCAMLTGTCPRNYYNRGLLVVLGTVQAALFMYVYHLSTLRFVTHDIELKMRAVEGNAKWHLKNWPVKGLCGMCLSVWGPEPHTPPPPLHTVYVNTVYLFTQGRGGGGRVEPEGMKEKRDGRATVHKARSKIPTWLSGSPVH
jgi:hypothetical protein